MRTVAPLSNFACCALTSNAWLIASQVGALIALTV